MDISQVQHYVPQFLLMGFTRGKKKQLYVFDKHNETVFKTTPRNVAAEKDFYNFEYKGYRFTLEPSLTNLEQVASTIINKIRQQQTIKNMSVEERAILSEFIAIQHIRVKKFREETKEIEQAFMEALQSRGIDVNQVKNFKSLSEEEIKIDSIMHLDKLVREIAPYIFDKHWILLKTVPSRPFIIGDNPVTLYNEIDYGIFGNIGFAVKGIQIYLPISETLSLLMICPEIIKELKVKFEECNKIHKNSPNYLREITKPIYERIKRFQDNFFDALLLPCETDNVKHHNALQIAWSNRWIFSPINDFSLAKRMIKDNESIRTGRRIKVD